MKNIFIDTNIIVDLIADRRPHSKFAIGLFKKAETKKVKLFASSHSLATTYYILKKYSEDKSLRLILLNLLDYLSIVSVDEQIIKRALKSKCKDFEDSIQILSALSITKMDGIVTRNLKDFKDSEIPVYFPEDILKKI